MAGHHRHRAELSHRPRVAEDDAVDQTPLHRWQRDVPERLPTVGPQRQRRLLLLRPGGLHDGYELAGDERERDEYGRKHDPGHGEDDLEVVRVEPLAEEAL